MKFWDKVAEDQALEQLRKARSNEPVKPAQTAEINSLRGSASDEIEWSNWRAAPQPVAVETAYHRPHKEKRTYEVTINGFGKRPVCDVFEATSPGLARVAALDKYGRWISIAEIKELKPKATRNRSSNKPGPRRSIATSQKGGLGKAVRHRRTRRRTNEVPAA